MDILKYDHLISANVIPHTSAKAYLCVTVNDLLCAIGWYMGYHRLLGA